MKQKKNSKKQIAVMFGGRSAEHEISIITALQAITAIDTLKYSVIPVYIHPSGKWYTGKELFNKQFYRSFKSEKVQEITLLPDPTLKGLLILGKNKFEGMIPIDIYFLAFHGQYGEDGSIQGLLEMANAAYTGCHLLSSAISMNKYHCKKSAETIGVPVLPGIVIRRQEPQQDLEKVKRTILETKGFCFPLFVKPCHLGSSIAISKVNDVSELIAALAKVFQYDDEALIEPCVTQLLEINVAVLGRENPVASVVEIPISTAGALTYEDKYLRSDGKTGGGSGGMASLTRMIDPKDLDNDIKKIVKQYAIDIYRTLKCSGVGRFDFMIDLESDKIYFNELNPIPGSFAYYLWEKSDPKLLYTDLIETMLQEAVVRKAEKASLQRNLGFKAL